MVDAPLSSKIGPPPPKQILLATPLFTLISKLVFCAYNFICYFLSNMYRLALLQELVGVARICFGRGVRFLKTMAQPPFWHILAEIV